MKLRIAHDLSLPIEAVTETFGILAKRGMGKTYTGMVMAEEMLKQHAQVVIADPVGVCWGLRSSADGKGSGFPIVVMGGEHGDVPLEEAAGAVVADFCVDTGAPVILDMSLLRKGAMVRFMTDFCERLYHAKAPEVNRTPMHLFLDEADAFAPQKPMPDQARLLGAIQDIVRRGRARGLGVTMITQRSAVLNKDVLTQIEVLIVLRTVSPQDRAAIKSWIEVHADDDGQQQLVLDSLASLPKGEAWFWSPGWLSILQRAHVRHRETFDSSATPGFGKQRHQVALAAIDLDSLRNKLAATIERAKADDPKQLRKRIAELERELKKRVDRPAVQERVVEVPPLMVEVPAVTPEQMLKLEQAVEGLRGIADGLLASLRSIRKPPPAHIPATRIPAPKPHASTRAKSDADGDLTGPERRILKALGELLSIGKTQPSKETVAGWASYAVNGGAFTNPLGALRTKGFVTYPFPGHVGLTEEGIAAVGNCEPPDQEELWKRIDAICTGPEKRILRAIIDNAGSGEISKPALASHAGYEPNGGAFTNPLGALRTKGLIDYPQKGMVRAADWLFLG